jgi:hypothetical protein
MYFYWILTTNYLIKNTEKIIHLLEIIIQEPDKIIRERNNNNWGAKNIIEKIIKDSMIKEFQTLKA